MAPDRRDDSLTHYKQFAQALQIAQAPFKGEMSKRAWAQEQLELQNRQIPEMIAAERAFVDAVCSSPRLKEAIFGGLIEQVRGQAKVSAAARGFTRERNLVFVRELLPALVRGDLDALPNFAWNWAFLNYAWSHVDLDVRRSIQLKTFCGDSELRPEPVRVQVPEALADLMLLQTGTVARLRDDLVVTNLQLVVDRALAFYRCTPETPQSTDMDSISNATEGLLAGVDKVMLECRPARHWPATWHPVPGYAYWRGQSAGRGRGLDGELLPHVMPTFATSGYRIEGHHTSAKHDVQSDRPECPATVFRTTAIGRMGAKLIQGYSQTHMHMGPDDRRLLYQANKVAARNSESGTPDYQGMATSILRDRVAWTLSQKSGVDPRRLSEAIDEALGDEGDWGRVPARVELAVAREVDKPQGEKRKVKAVGAAVVEGVLVGARRKAPSASAVAQVMLANSVVSAVDDDGEDRLNEASSYAISPDQQPDARLIAAERVGLARRALEYLSLLERKLLVLLGLAPLECVHYKRSEA